MNWIFDAYSNVYTTAMMQDQKPAHHAAHAKGGDHAKRASLFGFLARR